jgi:hypothetical protein
MLSLHPQHITDLFVGIDDLVPQPERSPLGGRPAVLTNSELITLLVWNALVLHQKTIKDLHTFTTFYLRAEFPKLPQYEGFLAHCHRVTPVMFSLLQFLLCADAPIKLLDSTMLPVCKLKRADRHKVARGIAAFGKNHQGWHYGFKLHVSITPDGKLCAAVLTPANIHDAQVMPRLLNQKTKLAVGDSTYGASVMGRLIWEHYGTIIIAPPHYKQKKKVMAAWQYLLLNIRSKIEAVFDVLKEHLHLVSSFPRSPFGYLVHYVRILLGYQIMALAAV